MPNDFDPILNPNLAEEILTHWARGDSLEPLGLTPREASDLSELLQGGLSASEQDELFELYGWSGEFLRELAGPDGLRPLWRQAQHFTQGMGFPDSRFLEASAGELTTPDIRGVYQHQIEGLLAFYQPDGDTRLRLETILFNLDEMFPEATDSTLPSSENESSLQLYARPPLQASPSMLEIFHLENDYQIRIARDLRQLLTQIHFDQANQSIHPQTYGFSPLYDNDLGAFDLRRRLEDTTNLQPRQALALQFLMYGQALDEAQVRELFGEQQRLLVQMQSLGMVEVAVLEGERHFRLRNLSLISHRLPNDEVMYLFTDLPTRLRTFSGRETAATAQVSETSYLLLHRLQRDFGQGLQHRGIMADFGSGTGILSIAMLRMHLGIDRALAVEIDDRSMNLSRLNAMLNGVEGRLEVVDNSSPANFTNALHGELLDLAITNPPFNAVPDSFGEEFTDFGDGGPLGLGVTELFLRQALPVMREGASLMGYSVLANNEAGQFFLTPRVSQLDINGIHLIYEDPGLENLAFDTEGYAVALATYLERHRREAAGMITRRFGGPPDPDHQLVDQIRRGLTGQGIAHLEPRFWQVRREGGAGELRVSFETRPLQDFVQFYRQRNQIPQGRPGGIYIEAVQRSGVYRTRQRTYPR